MEFLEIENIIEENDNTKTFFFKDERLKDADAGQFVMVWLPKIGEKPMSLSYIGETSAITVRDVGPFSSKIHKLKKGDKLGIRGPYGNGFKIRGDSILLVAGGMGIAPLFAFLDKLEKEKINFRLIYGTKEADEIIFKSKLDKINSLVVSEDHKLSRCGKSVDFLEEELEKSRYDMIAACGPEFMLKCMIDKSKEIRIPIYLSLERYMKCGIGICGSCSIDPSGKMVCKDGPVFEAETLQNSEIGLYRRDKSGIKKEVV